MLMFVALSSATVLSMVAALSNALLIYYSQKVKGQLHFVGMEDKVKLVANKKQLE